MTKTVRDWRVKIAAGFEILFREYDTVNDFAFDMHHLFKTINENAIQMPNGSCFLRIIRYNSSHELIT